MAAQALHVHPSFDAEAAAHTALEFVSSLDNLPGEVTFLLEEIRDKETRIHDLLRRISVRHVSLTKHRNPPPSGNTSAPFHLPIPAGAPLPTAHLTSKDQQGIMKIMTEWGKVEALQEEKIKLAERLERITTRARERGRAEWVKVGGMDLEEVERDGKVGLGGFAELGSAEVLLPPGGLGSGFDGRQPKRRKPNALPLPLPMNGFPIVHPPIPHPSAMLPPPIPTSRTARSSRNARHVSTSTMSELDAEGEADVPEPADGEAEDTLYCICQKPSYGEMIGCDSQDCQYEWFHVGCVDIVGALPDTWFCPDCVKRLGLTSSSGGRDKKGRRK